MKKLNFKILLPIAGIFLLVTSVLALQGVLAGIGLGIAGMLIFGPNVEQIKGKTAGIVYVNGKTGPYTRARIKAKNPQTPAQQANRMNHKKLMKQWKTEQVDKVAFNNYAASHPVPNKMGRMVHISGINWFVKFNRYAQKADPTTALITKPPITDTLFPFLTGLNLTANFAEDSVIIEPVKIGDYVPGMRLDVWATRQMSAGVFSTKDFRSIGVFDPTQSTVHSTQSTDDRTQSIDLGQLTIDNRPETTANIEQASTSSATSSATGIDISAAYIERFGDLELGMKIFVKARLIMPTGENNLFVSNSAGVY